jgi:integrase
MLTQPQFRAVWNSAKDEVGLGSDPQVVPHILRHTCASRLVQGGIDMRRIQMWLGHQTLQMTMRYAHLATNDLDSCVVVLENRVQPQPAPVDEPSATCYPSALEEVAGLDEIAAKPRASG